VATKGAALIDEAGGRVWEGAAAKIWVDLDDSENMVSDFWVIRWIERDKRADNSEVRTSGINI
jgi:hypothetical protein